MPGFGSGDDISSPIQKKTFFSVAGKAAAQKAAHLSGGTLSESKAITDMRTATEQAFELIDTIAQIREKHPRPKFFGFGSDPASRSLHSLKSLLNATPCLVDLNARRDVISTSAVRPQNDLKFTLLHTAAKEELADVVSLLLDHGADINAVCHSGSVLAVSMSNGHHGVAKLLLSRGADAVRYQPTPKEVAEFGIQGDIETQPILLASASSSRAHLIPAIIAAGADPNTCASSGNTPLCLAAFYSHVSAVANLINYGANPNDLNAPFTPLYAMIRTPIYESAGHSHFELAALLFNSGANLLHPVRITNPRNRRNNEDTPIDHIREALHPNNVRIAQPKEQKELQQALIKLFEDRLELATQTWKRIIERASAGCIICELSAQELILCANIGKLQDVMALPGWLDKPGYLQTLLSELPPWMSEEIAVHHPYLLNPTHTDVSSAISHGPLIAPRSIHPERANR